MMKFIAVVLMMLPSLAIAEECSTSLGEETIEETLEINTDVPSHLKGATVCTKRADGAESCVSAEKFKVVPRQQQFVVKRTKQVDKVRCESVIVQKEKAEKEKNRVSLMAGKGPKDGLTVTQQSPDEVTVENRVGAIGGAQYQRLLTEKVSVGAQLQTNKSILINVGLDF